MERRYLALSTGKVNIDVKDKKAVSIRYFGN